MKAEIHLSKSEVALFIQTNLDRLIPGLISATAFDVEVEIDKYSRQYCTITLSDEGSSE